MNEQTQVPTSATQASFLALNRSAQRTYELLLSHEYMKLDKICERAQTADPTLRRGQIEGALKILRDAGWVKWAKCPTGLKLKWKRCDERLLVPMEPSTRRTRRTQEVDTNPDTNSDQLTMSQLTNNLAKDLGHIELALKEARSDLASLQARLKLFQ